MIPSHYEFSLICFAYTFAISTYKLEKDNLIKNI